MPNETNDRLDLSCLISNLPATIVTRLGTVYQGTILDWNCRRTYKDPNSVTSAIDDSSTPPSLPTRASEEYGGFIRLELTCRPGEICCDSTPVDTPAIVNGIRSSVNNNYPLFEIGNTVLINWDDISSIGPQRDCLTA